MCDLDRQVEYGGKLYSRTIIDGYIVLRPIIDGKVDASTSVPEHRLVYELATGTKLGDNMVIHHLNRNRSDNRLSNLIALTRSDHAKLHSFEDRGEGAEFVANKVSPPYRRGNSNRRRLNRSYKTFSSVLQKLVAYDNKIYLREEHGGYGVLFQVIDGKIDRSTTITEHRLIYELHYGVKLTSDIQIHHINHDKLDNRPENLRAMSISEHMKLHALENGYHVGKNHCIDCGSEISWKNKRCAKCNYAYLTAANGRKERPSKDVLEDMIQTMSNSEIAREYGVSDTAVRKWRKKYGLPSSNEQHGWSRGIKRVVVLQNTQPTLF